MGTIPFRPRLVVDFTTSDARDTIMKIQQQWGDKSLQDMFLSGALLLHQSRTFLEDGYEFQLVKNGRVYAFKPDVAPK